MRGQRLQRVQVDRDLRGSGNRGAKKQENDKDEFAHAEAPYPIAPPVINERIETT